MSTTPLAMSHRAYLYADSGRIDVPSVLVRLDGQDLAVFAPWPASLGPTSRIAVGIHPHREPGDAWPGVVGVQVLDISGAGTTRDLGVVTLARQLTFSPGQPAQRVSAGRLAEAIAEQPGDIGTVLARLGDDLFGGLGDSRAATAAPAPLLGLSASGAGPPDAAPTNTLASPTSFTLEGATPIQTAEFICRIFRWD